MDQYFGRMLSLMNNKELPARIRFLLQDTVELRDNNWVPRKAFIDNGPKTINQIRQEAVKVSQLQSIVWTILRESVVQSQAGGGGAQIEEVCIQTS